ncbi:hypothetical protein V7x_28440 [Crateriforma conspicua]|uniref:Uncharacterized protein n=1 Tax=Crateriforma conspicua TaxID=2527996 RepID=A0A5C6G1A5_9PLAN|nr:hypothetical protein [Crateriforma conspicua]TWU67270.1 hypothetical protein V7x_28440 [Crateriforma conspicua]
MLQKVFMDPRNDDRYRVAREWANDAILSDIEADDPRRDLIFEYSEKALEDQRSHFDKAIDNTHSLLRLNALLVAGVFAVFRSTKLEFTICMQAALACWVFAMVPLLVACRRIYKPRREDMPEIFDYVNNHAGKLTEWLSMYNHLCTTQFVVQNDQESTLVNWSLCLTVFGLAFLVFSTLGL